MRYYIYLFLIFLFTSFSHAIDIDENSSNLSILDKAFIFIDKTNNLSLEEIKKKKFLTNSKTSLNFGYKADRILWIKFTLRNKTPNKIKKTLVFDSQKIESVTLYNSNQIRKGGFHHLNENSRTLTPSFILKLDSHESKTYYVQTIAKSKPLVSKITLWDNEDFIRHDLINIVFIVMFLGMLVVLFIYNTMILLFLRDKAYLYYVFYLCSVMIFTTYYAGFLPFYILSPEWASWSMRLQIGIAPITFFFTILFTQEILQTRKFKKLHKTLNFSLFVLLIIFVLSYYSSFLNLYYVAFYVLLGISLIFTGFYALFKGIKEAKYYVFAWSPLILILSTLALESSGFFTLKIKLTYASEVAFVLEALLFSIALAHRIKITNDEKALADAKLICFQEEEKEHLNILVEEKTSKLNHSLNEKEILYKELNHRVKNNFMMILSLLKLQISRSSLVETKESLKVTENRIKSIANLYEMLLLNNENINVDTQDYLQKIYRNISLNFQKEVKIEYDIQHDIELNSLIYVGLVFNELITNSFKYAFPNDEGKIFVTLKKENNQIFLSIKDNGQGFKERRKNSLGLTIVETLVEGQLTGELDINSTYGTEVLMSWKV